MFLRTPSPLVCNMHVFHTPLSLLHDPPTEILSGRPIKPYESPARVGRILSALLPDDPEPLFTEQACHWDSDEVLQDKDLLDAIKQVHGPGYLDFLKTVYDQWCKEGGSKVRTSTLSHQSARGVQVVTSRPTNRMPYCQRRSCAPICCWNPTEGQHGS